MTEPTRLTLKDVARILGVSRTTVSNAYNRPDQLSAELRESIFARARELGYHGPHAAGRLLRTGKTHSIGLVFYDRFSSVFEDEQALMLIQGISSVLEESGVSLVMIPTMSTKQETNNALGALVDSFILFSGYNQESNPMLTLIRSRGLPLVSIDHKYPDIPMVGIDDYAAAALAARRVLEAGHRRVLVMALAFHQDGQRGFVGRERFTGLAPSTGVNRMRGYLDVLDGTDGVETRVFETAQFDFASPVLTELARDMLEGAPEATAVLCMSDYMARAVVSAAKQLGRRVPEDVSVVGFDGIRSGQAGEQPLTTVRQPIQDKGALVARMMLGEQPAEDRLLPVDWEPGTTLAPPAN